MEREVRNYLYPVEVYNAINSEKKIVALSTESLDFFGLKVMKGKYDSGFPKLDLKGNDPFEEVLMGNRPLFRVKDDGLRQMIYTYMVTPDPHSI